MQKTRDAKLGAFVIAGIITAAAALFFFGWLADEMLHADTAIFDMAVRDAIHSVASPAMTSAMIFFSFLGSVAWLGALTIVVIGLFLYYHRRRAAVLMAVTMAGAVILDVTLKHAFHRVRPIAFFGSSPSSYSFPSGHSFASLCFYGALAVILSARVSNQGRRVYIWLAASVVIALVGISRIYLGVHYPSDVVGGYCAAVVWVMVIALLDRWLRMGHPLGPEQPASASNAP